MLRISNTLYTSKFCLGFRLPYLSDIMWPVFSLYIDTAHYSLLQFPVFVYPLVNIFCSHYVLQVVILQALDGSSLVDLSTWD